MTILPFLPHLYWVFLQIGLFSFGGGYAMFPLIKAEVIGREWLSASEFVDIVAVAEMTPGTIAANSATFTGFQIAGFPGAIIATLGVITPSLVLLLFWGNILLKAKENAHMQSVLKGLRPAFIALIAMAAVFLGETSFVDLPSVIIFGVLFGLIIWRKVSPFLLIGTGALLGIILYPLFP